MSLQQAPYYWLECDHPNKDGTLCAAKSTEGGDYSAWEEEDSAWEEAMNSDWTEIEGKHYCHNHAHQHQCDGSETCTATPHTLDCYALKNAPEIVV